VAKKKPYIRLRPRLDAAGEGYPFEMRGLLALGRPKEDTNYTEWADRLRDFVPQLLQMTLDDDLNTRPEKDRAVWAPLHALSILAELAPEAAAEPLLQVLEWDDDWSMEPLGRYYARAGEAAARSLEQYVIDINRAEMARGRAIAALAAVAETNANQRDGIIAFLTRYLEEGSSDTLEEEYVITSAVLALVDLRAVESLPAIERAFEEDRVETFMVSLGDVKKGLGLAAEETEAEPTELGLTLSLKCLTCGRDREYSLPRAFLDLSAFQSGGPGTIGRALYTPDPVICAHCGAVDQFELGKTGNLAIMAMISGALSGQPNATPNLKMTSIPVGPWGWLPPREALARYRAEIAAHPDNTGLRLDYADGLLMLDEVDAALEEYEKVLLVNPAEGEALLAIAEIKVARGELSGALGVWERIEREFDRLQFKDTDRAQLRRSAAAAIAGLRAGRAPDAEAWARPEENATPGTFTTPDNSQYGKVGRNERCPCGSGKKYKQCHGRK
jgi:tetratricopeptide (TPR) repeat protein